MYARAQVCWWLAWYPGLIPAVFHLLLLRSMFWQYVHRRFLDNAQTARVVMMDGMVLESKLAEQMISASALCAVHDE